jgi:hypothetical protein
MTNRDVTDASDLQRGNLLFNPVPQDTDLSSQDAYACPQVTLVGGNGRVSLARI